MKRDPYILEADTPAERLLWAGEFSSVRSDNATLLSQLSAFVGDMYPTLLTLPPDWFSLVRGRQILSEGEYDQVESVLLPALRSKHQYVVAMASYVRSWAAWLRGENLAQTIEDTQIDTSTQFGSGLAHNMLAWHQQRDNNFTGHLQSLCESAKEFMKCDPIPVYWVARTLVPLLHTSFEMGSGEAESLGRQVFTALIWPRDLERQRYDCLRALSRFAFQRGDYDSALSYISLAKMCDVPPAIRAQSFLHSASYALESGEPLWAREQLIMADELVKQDKNVDRTVILSLALNHAEMNPQKAKGFLAEYHVAKADMKESVSFDRRQDAVADISLAKIGLALEPGDPYCREVLVRAYGVVNECGFHYRAAIAASEIAGTESSRKRREQWMKASISHIIAYGPGSPLLRLLSSKMEQSNLTPQERRVRDLVRSGMSNKQIAAILCTTEQRVKNLLFKVYQKYGVNHRAQLLSRLNQR